MRMRCCRGYCGPRGRRRVTRGGRRTRCRHDARRKLLILLAARRNRSSGGDGAAARGRGRGWLAYLLVADAWIFPACRFCVVVDEVTGENNALLNESTSYKLQLIQEFIYVNSTIFLLYLAHLHDVSRQFDPQNGMIQPDDIGCVLGVEISLNCYLL